MREGEHLCFACQPNRDINSPSYFSDACKMTRKYLKDTDPNWKLIYYRESFSGSEVWQCQKCKRCIEFATYSPGMMRESVHEMGRQNHSCPPRRDNEDRMIFL